MKTEPVFVRHERTKQYVYNPRSRLGRALIVLTPIVASSVLYSLYSGWHWSEGELRTAVHRAADALNAKPQYASPEAPQDYLIRNAIEESRTGPGHGVSVYGDGPAGYTISTQDTDTKFCMRLLLTPVDPDKPFPAALERHHVIATATEGPCRRP
ncbi:hypothetical protein OG444_31955 [Streptomyces sp. NBC_01232]|uniref:hypothetical protein n=1 Tax=unclassified Streptomyces TaxID=2593676 RepID=UPI00224CB9B0|nr:MULTISPECIES: hypothetical protein [unclassified Streptomyces]MCX4806963.1 hypothetical protein [Streptomyces sp. NBC_01214]WSQ01869.1 hypothetical protein OG444_31955 [Streptomyces sp. NBC_01232]